MYTTASVHIYDLMDSIHITYTVQTWNSLDTTEPQRITATIVVPGTGEENQQQWLQDALVAVLETL